MTHDWTKQAFYLRKAVGNKVSKALSLVLTLKLMKDYYGAIRLKVRRIKAVTSLRLYTHSRRQSESQLEFDQ